MHPSSGSRVQTPNGPYFKGSMAETLADNSSPEWKKVVSPIPRFGENRKKQLFSQKILNFILADVF